MTEKTETVIHLCAPLCVCVGMAGWVGSNPHITGEDAVRSVAIYGQGRI